MAKVATQVLEQPSRTAEWAKQAAIVSRRQPVSRAVRARDVSRCPSRRFRSRCRTSASCWSDCCWDRAAGSPRWRSISSKAHLACRYLVQPGPAASRNSRPDRRIPDGLSAGSVRRRMDLRTHFAPLIAWAALAGTAGEVVLFAGGLGWLFVLTHSVSLAFKWGLYWFVFAEVIKIAVAAGLPRAGTNACRQAKQLSRDAACRVSFAPRGPCKLRRGKPRSTRILTSHIL